MRKLIVMLLALTVMLSAAFVDQNRAQKLAESHYKTYAPSETLKGNTVQRIIPRMYNGEITMYTVVFNDGFVIVNAEDNLSPIIGYSYKTIKEIPEDGNCGEAYEAWFGNYDKQIENARETGYSNPVAVKEWKSMEAGEFTKGAKGVVVAPLIESHWDQEYPYNDACPELTGETCVVGCVATATSQVIRYHEQDTQGYGSSSYYWSAGGQTLAINHSTQTFDYSLMPLSGYNTQAEVDELAKLCMNVGYAVEMDYNIASVGSGAYSSDVEDALLDHFGYTVANYVYHGTPSTATPSWCSTIESSLDDGKPIVYSGSGSSGGHAFNLDGYSTDNWYHFNWGWGGSSDGNFQLNALNPGGMDFTQSQSGVYNIYAGPFPWNEPTNFGGSIANGEDVTLTWTAASTPGKTLTGYQIFRASTLYGTVGLVTSYNDFDLSPGSYVYYVKAVYADGISHMTPGYSADVVKDPNYPVATALLATTMGRTTIDLEWGPPFVGQVFYEEDFESTQVSTVWHHERTIDYPPTGRRISGTRDNFTKADITDGWGLIDAASFGGDDPQYIHSGIYSLGLGYTPTDHTWAFSPSFTLASGDNASLQYWVWSYGDASWQSTYYCNLYSGDFSELDPSGNLDELGAYVDVGTTLPTNEYETMIVKDLSSYVGTYRLAFTYKYTDGYQMMVDDIVIGSGAKSAKVVNYKPVTHVPAVRLAEVLYPVDDSSFSTNTSSKAAKADTPTSYDVYRNGALATNVSYTGVTPETWSDAGFADGDNEYYVKVVYPTGTSLASIRANATIIANPAPDYLTGVLNANLADVDLTWYAPLTMPPHWYGYIDALDATFDNIEGMTGSWSKRRTTFTGTNLGMTYPITVDSLAAAFYDDGSGWSQSTFTFKVYTAAFDGSDSILMAETSNLTAVSDAWITIPTTSTLTMNMGWYVEIGGLATDGTPTSLVSMHPGGSASSSVYYGGDTTYDPGWYTITFGSDPGDWAIICYGEGSDQEWFYNKEAQVEKLAMAPYKELPAVKDEITTTTGNKSMVQYNIWRNGSVIDNTSNKYYSDVAAPAGDNVYEISAVYATPTGESAKCTSVMVHVDGGGPVTPDVPANLTTSISAGNLTIDWDDSADATGYDVYSSDDPYGAFSFVISVTPSTYTIAAGQAKLFYQIIATNGTKVAPKTIEVVKSVK